LGSQRNYLATFEVKEATVIGRYTSQRNEDDVPGFDVMLKKQNEVVTLSTTIKGPNSYRCENGFSSVRLKNVSVIFCDAPEPNNETSSISGQFHELILAI
jgi:hypothetical protein